MERRMFFRAALLASAVVTLESMQARQASAFFWWVCLQPPCLSLVSVEKTFVTIKVTAGSRGAPGGFTIQWMKKSDYIANCNRWYSSSDPRMRKAIYAPTTWKSPYLLKCGASIDVTVGQFPADVCTNGGPLEAETEYIFRSFAHGYSCYTRSDFSCDLCATTAPVGLPPT